MHDGRDAAREPLGRRLDSWKEIAAYFGRGVTTVQRWEQDEGLPVHRHTHVKKGSVFAFESELAAWRVQRAQANAQPQAAGEPIATPDVPPPQDGRGSEPTHASIDASRESRPDDVAGMAPSPLPAGTRLVSIRWMLFNRIGVASILLGAFAIAIVSWRSFTQPSQGEVPPRPTNLVTSSPRPGVVVLTWSDRSSDETHFQVGLFGNIALTTGPDATRAEFNGLDAGTSYHWDLRACNASGCSPWHGVVGRTPDGSAAVEGLSPTAWEGRSSIAFASDRVGGHWQIWSMDETGANPRRLTYGAGNDMSPAWSGDRTRIAFVSDRSGYNAVYVMNSDGSHLTALTNSAPAHDSMPCWSPDGSRIAFVSDRSGDHDIWVMDADGTHLVNLTHTAGSDSYPAWSPNGRQIAFASDRAGGEHIYVMSLDGSDVRRLTTEGVENRWPAWSPDGRRIAFTRVNSGKADIFVTDASGNGAINITHHPAEDHAPRWSPDGSRIAFETNRDGNTEIYAVNPDGFDVLNLTSTRSADITPDWGVPTRRRTLTTSMRLLSAPLGGSIARHRR